MHFDKKIIIITILLFFFIRGSVRINRNPMKLIMAVHFDRKYYYTRTIAQEFCCSDTLGFPRMFFRLNKINHNKVLYYYIMIHLLFFINREFFTRLYLIPVPVLVAISTEC